MNSIWIIIEEKNKDESKHVDFVFSMLAHVNPRDILFM